jgi:hypothetical protein
MDVKTTMACTHVFNVAVEGSAVRSTGCGEPSGTRAARLDGPTGRPKTERASCWARQKSLQVKRLPTRSGTGRFVLG